MKLKRFKVLFEVNDTKFFHETEAESPMAAQMNALKKVRFIEIAELPNKVEEPKSKYQPNFVEQLRLNRLKYDLASVERSLYELQSGNVNIPLREVFISLSKKVITNIKKKIDDIENPKLNDSEFGDTIAFMINAKF